MNLCIRGYEMFFFRKIWFALFYLNTRLEIRHFALLPTTRLTKYVETIHKRS